MKEKEEAFRWFCLGFAQSREGYNAECAFSHLAPSEPQRFEEGNRYIQTEVPDEIEDLFEQLWDNET